MLWSVLLIACQPKDWEGIKTDIGQKTLLSAGYGFDANRAFENIEKQVAFGPRVPGLSSHMLAKDWIVHTLDSLGLTTEVQAFKTKNYQAEMLELYNIKASFKPEAEDRILLMTHWDTRPFADNESEDSLHHELPDGANDGGSGTAVLLEVARLLSLSGDRLDIGVDIVLFDGEEAGPPMYDTSYEQLPSYYCLGSQYYAENPMGKVDYREGILLDIIAGKDAQYHFEHNSLEMGEQALYRFWALAHANQMQSWFIPSYAYFVGGDDHIVMHKAFNFPCFAVIEYDEARDGYNQHQHKVSDELAQIDVNALSRVGTNLWSYIINYRLINEEL